MQNDEWPWWDKVQVWTPRSVNLRRTALINEADVKWKEKERARQGRISNPMLECGRSQGDTIYSNEDACLLRVILSVVESASNDRGHDEYLY